MNSIKKNAKKLREFFMKRLIPLMQARHQKSKEYFSLVPDNNVDSYYRHCIKKTVNTDCLKIFQPNDAKTLHTALVSMWEQQGETEMASFTGDIIILAETIAANQEQYTEEISPFIYVMF